MGRLQHRAPMTVSLLSHSRNFRAPVGVMALVVYLFAQLGSHIAPLRQPRLGLSAKPERYPCENCGCSCSGATECWTQCCCFSVEERLAWSLAIGIAPPESVSIADEVWVRAAKSIREDAATCAACVPRLKADLALGKRLVGQERSQTVARASCCSEKRDDKSAVLSRGRVVSALACKKIAAVMTFAFVALPTAVVWLANISPRPQIRACPTIDSPPSATLEIPTPPPR